MRTIFRLVLAVAASVLASVAWAQEEDWQPLFDGRTFMGWQANAEHPTSFEIEDGAIKVNGPRCHLYYVGEVNGGVFRDFEFKAKVKTLPNSNSGIYFHSKFQREGWPDTGYECQVNNSHSDWRKTGGLYGVQDVKDPPSKDNEWFDYYIKVYGKRVIIKVNGEPLVDYNQPENPEHAKDFPGRLINEGAFCLQAHDPGSTAYFKDIHVRPLK